ncbi:heterokaryon incompatibility protein-domain-containing protein [Podospora aff. communis PSN243]|uniref:Heterokaryon incompatibility protein-domain-containing protein n=1 Tax=Podospora aff. communis PSN243 TaxID=3040156 RepID=A0AAV9GCG4_9PEZI|nr:heterokaryon incompatibility protein-domain-containing protein [Podospora aff. communis PSN243]
MARILPYEYATLPDRSIRLLRLRPGPPGSPLVCSLHDECLDGPNIQYKAVSYCWGDEHPPCQLLVDNKGETRYLPIRPNLAAALNQLRTNTLACCDLSCVSNAHDDNCHPGEDSQFASPVKLWIDAVCINQASIDERSRQVALMHEVYTRAMAVLAWLGPSNQFTTHALRMVHIFARLAESPSCETQIDTGRQHHGEGEKLGVDTASARRQLGINPAFISSWIALGHFFADNHWWERMWIVQEVVLARRVIMVAGRFGTTWTRFVQASDVFHQDNIYEQLCARQRYQLGILAAPMLPVMSLLGWTFRYKATNPRDKVYGIFGILKGLGVTLPMQPRDDISICEVYMRTVKLIYDQTRDLSFIEAVENNLVVNCERRFDLPSWTPDFAAPNNLLPISWARLGDTAALYRESWAYHWSGGERDHCLFDFAAKTITVRGFRIDTIGFTQVAACVGDEVCWLIGLGFPCLLRRDGGRWRYIGLWLVT